MPPQAAKAAAAHHRGTAFGYFQARQPENIRRPTETQGSHRDLIGAERQLATCPACRHVGAVPRNAPGKTRLRCTACHTVALIRQCVGPRPTPFRHRSSDRRPKDAAVADVLSRYGGTGDLNDSVDDLFRAGDGGAS